MDSRFIPDNKTKHASVLYNNSLSATSHSVYVNWPRLAHALRQTLKQFSHEDDMEEACLVFTQSQHIYGEKASYIQYVGQPFTRMRSRPAADRCEHTHPLTHVPAAAD